MKRRSVAASIFVGLVFWTGKEVNRAEKDIDYFNEHVLSSKTAIAAETEPAMKDAVKNPEPVKSKVKCQKRRVIDSEKIYANADYLVKIRIFKMVTIPGTEQTIPRDTESFGSGSIVKCRKYKYCVLTAFHVVDNSSMTYFAEPKDGSPAKVLELINGSTYYDNALLRFADPNYVPKKTAKLGRSSILKPGTPIYAFGSNSYGNFWHSTGHLYTEVKYGNPRMKDAFRGSGMENAKLLQISTIIYPGFSGGPLLNKYGELIGISDAYLRDPNQPAVIYIGSPIDEIRKIQKIIK